MPVPAPGLHLSAHVRRGACTTARLGMACWQACFLLMFLAQAKRSVLVALVAFQKGVGPVAATRCTDVIVYVNNVLAISIQDFDNSG